MGLKCLIILVVAILAGLGVYFGVSKSYHMNGKTEEYPYTKYGKIRLNRKEDRFINQTVTHQRIETNSSSGSGGSRSSTHSSSSGGTHGGGGRSF